MKKYHIVYFTPDEELFSKGVTFESETMQEALELFIKQFGYEPFYIIQKND